MTDRDALYRCILESPRDDLPRLIYADWLEENNEAARAEFIRVQVELARTLEPELKTVRAIDPTKRQQDGGICTRCSDESECRYHELRRRDREMKTPRNMAKWFPTVPILGANLKRGFISSIRCSWSDWLRHHAAIYWHPEQTVECLVRVLADNHRQAAFNAQDIVKLGNWFYGHTLHHFLGTSKDDPIYWVGTRQDRRLVDRLREHGFTVKEVDTLRGTGRIPRPFVATAQPLEVVRLTDWPDPIALNDTRPADTIYTIDRTFDRVKCPTCNGMGTVWPIQGDWVRCSECTGRTPLNRWTCDKWKGLVFEMPDAAAHEVAPPVAGWTWRVDRSGLPPPINNFTATGLLTVHLEWFHQWDGDDPTLGTQFRVDQPDITIEAFLNSVEPELRGRERWLRLTAVGSGVPIFRGESVLR